MVVRAADGSPGFLVTQFEDISERQETENKFRELALLDALTDLPNRRLFDDRLRHALTRFDRTDLWVALLYLDLNLFKQVNDRFGHQAGDDLLVEVANALRRLVRPGDTVARLGGDEFVVLAEDLRGVADAWALALRLHDGLKFPVGDGTPEMVVTASLRAAITPAHMTTPPGWYMRPTLHVSRQAHLGELPASTWSRFRSPCSF